MIGKAISHYKILEKLGRGGMGVVYKARDLKLDRFVALKFFPQPFGQDEEKERFIHEAKAASALEHLNICNIHEIDETEDGQMFIVMACYEGETLNDKIKNKRLKIKDTIDYAIQIAQGLADAHKKGIVHRDIKTANIFITNEGIVKILDFGLAKLCSQTKLTKAGTTLGTVAYMSPEQTKGEEVDHRTDIWSLGVVLYEMLTGELPFKGDYEQAVIYSILNDEIKSLIYKCTELLPELERIVQKCLSKNPDDRYQNIDDFLVDLRLSAGSIVSSTRHENGRKETHRAVRNPVIRAVSLAAVILTSTVLLLIAYFHIFRIPYRDSNHKVKKLAVLFFENLGPPEDEYFADGITDAITARLSLIHELGVISRQSSIQYKGSKKSIREIGEELRVNYILEGTIQRERPGDPTSRIRIIPQLINVSDDIHLWADTYDEDMTEVFSVQSEIAEHVAHALSITLLDEERKALEVIPTQNLEAYEYYLRGNEFTSKRYRHENMTAAIQMYERAVKLDPRFAEAWARLSQAYIWEYYSAVSYLSDRKIAAKNAIDRAQDLAPDLPDIQISLGHYYYYGEHNFDRALKYLETARRNLPNDVEILNTIAFIKRRQGKWEEGAALLERSEELDPRNCATAVELGITYATMRQYDKGKRYVERAIFLAPEEPLGYVFKMAQYILADGDTEKARKTLLEASEFIRPAELGIEIQPFVLMRIMPDTYAELLSRTLKSEYGIVDTTVFHIGLAEIYHQLDQDEKARKVWKAEQIHLESAENPLYQDDIDFYRALTYAGLGHYQEAIRITNEVLASSPLSVDAFLGTFRLNMAALIYVRVGAYEQAIDQLEQLLSVPSLLSRPLLLIDPAWDPLRKNPRFQKLVAEELSF